MSELDVIARIRRMARNGYLGDDCAILRPSPGEDLLVTTDLFVEGVHFRKARLSAAGAGQRCLARGLSDIAAMGGTPRWCFVSLALDSAGASRWVDGFYRGLLELAGRHRVELAGGDITRAKRITADIVVIGSVPRGKALTRSGARAGDAIYVSGLLGRAAVQRYRAAVEPRLELGRFLRARASSCMDLSDGLALDLFRLCTESGVSAELDHPLPVAPGATLEQALGGGEDYELLFTAPQRTRIPRSYRGVPLTRIGCVVKGSPSRLRFFGRPQKRSGWDPL